MEGLASDNSVEIIRMSYNNFVRADFIKSSSLKEL